MSPVGVALGWDVFNATVVPARLGRLCVISDGLKDDSYPSWAGYDGFGNDEARPDSDLWLQGVIRWLSGKATGANILLVSDWCESEAQAGLTRLGHTYTACSGFTSGGDYDPLDYDAAIGSYGNLPVPYHGAGTRAAGWDYFFANDGNVMSLATPGGGAQWSAYGIPIGNTYHYGGGSYGHTIQIAFEIPARGAPLFATWGVPADFLSQWGAAGTYEYVQAANVGFAANLAGSYENTKGGHRMMLTCTAGHSTKGIMGFWTRD